MGPPTAAAGAEPPPTAVRTVLLADTHLPRRARVLPAPLWDAVDAADLVIHAGDFTDEATLDALEARSARLLAVAGNNDGLELHSRLPEVARVEVAGLVVAVVHETGPAPGRERRCAQRHPDADLLVFGHSHIPWDTATQRDNGSMLRLLNPGSPTDRRRQPHCTFMTALLDAGTVRGVVLHRL